MKFVRTTLLTVAALLIGLAGCEVTDPGTPLGNQAPTTILSRAPQNNDTVNHYLELRWAGNDEDGQIAGFVLLVDGAQIAFTTATDTTISFSSTTDGEPTQHSFGVIARDNEGADDPNPPSRTFHTTNVSPSVLFADGSVPPGAGVGHGFQMILESQDDNRSLIWFSLSLEDEQHWTEWSQDSTYLIADPTLGFFPEGTILISNEGLEAGELTLYARVKDAGDAISAVQSRTIMISDTNRPAMNPTVEGVYGTEDFFPDGSVYRRNNVETQITYSATAGLYNGQIHSYRFQEGDAEWSEWSDAHALILEDLPTGEYPFKFTARDLAGELSDTIDYTIRIVEQQFTDQIIVVDETRDGNGNPGSPDDEQVDLFYRALVEGRNYLEIDYASRPGGVPYVSPYDLKDAGLVFWHADDRSDLNLAGNTAVLDDYLDKGGRLLLGGWDVLAPFNAAALDTVEFAAGSFPYEKLRVFEGYYARTRHTSGITAIDSIANITVDEAKLPANFNGLIDRVWVFNQRGECTVTGTLTVDNPEENPYEGGTAAYYYDQSFRVAVFGVPLYFFKQDEVVTMIGPVIDRLLFGL